MSEEQASAVLKLYHKFLKFPMGKKLFSKAVCHKAPYFGSIKPKFVELKPGYCEISIKNRRSVHNHIGTVHAIAMANMCELAAGMMTDVTIPISMRWIPKGMTIEYLKKADTDLRAACKLERAPEWGEAQHLPVTVNVLNTNGDVVVRAVITMWVSPKSKTTDKTPATPAQNHQNN